MDSEGRKCTVAVVDDDAGFRRALGRLIQSAGFEVDAYERGAEFLAAAAEHPTDCVVLDLQMPGMDGLEVQARMNRSGIRIPIVVVTGYDTPDSEARFLERGASAYLRKPVDQEVLLQAIRGAVAARGSRR